MKELVWLLAPMLGLYRQLGGTLNKLIWRGGFPLSVILSTCLFLGWSWWWLVMGGLCLAVSTLPVTLFGDAIIGNIWNLLWLPILGYLHGLPSLIIGIKYKKIIESLFLSLIPSLVFGLVITLSNYPLTADMFPWKLCEGILGFSVGIPYAFLIEKINKENNK